MPDSQRLYHKDTDSQLTQRKGSHLKDQQCYLHNTLPFVRTEVARRQESPGCPLYTVQGNHIQKYRSELYKVSEAILNDHQRN